MSNKYTNCILELQNSLGQELTGDQKKEMQQTIETLAEKFQSEPTAQLMQEKVLKAIDQMADEAEIRALNRKRQKAIDAVKRITEYENLIENYSDSPKMFFQSLAGEANINRKNSRAGLQGAQASAFNYHAQIFQAKLQQDGVLDLAASGHIDKEVFEAMAVITEDVIDEGALAKLPKEAVTIAKTVRDSLEYVRLEANKAGAAIGKLKGYVMKRSHDMVKIAKAAGDHLPSNSPEHARVWKSFMDGALDWSKSFIDVPISKRDKVLSDLFEQLSNGYHVVFSEGGGGKSGNLASKMEHKREMHFKSPELEYEYFKKFGKGSSVLDGVTRHLQVVAQETALMERLGPNALENITRVKDKFEMFLTDQRKGHLVPELNKEFAWFSEEMWPQLNGQANLAAVADLNFAKKNRAARSIMSMGKLGFSAINSITDIMAAGLTSRFTGERSQGAFFDGVWDAATGVLGNVGKTLTPEQKMDMAEFGLLLETSSPINLMSDEDWGTKTDNLLKKFFKLNGQSYVTDQLMVASAKGTAFRHARYASSPFDQIPQGMRELFEQFGIDQKGWDAIRSTELKVDGDGRRFIDPSKIADEKLKKKYRQMIRDIASLTVTEPTKMDRAFMYGSLKPGTARGEMARHFWQFKSYTLAYTRRHFLREVRGYDANMQSVPQALWRIAKGENMGALGGLASMAVYGTAAGYITNNVRDMLKGKEPVIPQNAEQMRAVVGAAFLRSGFGGVYGDLLLGNAKTGADFLKYFAGPAVTTAADAYEVYLEARKKATDGEGDPLAKAMNFASRNTPGANLFYAKAALDYALIYGMQEAANPGYLRRMERKMEKEYGQKFIFPPSQHAVKYK